MAEAEPGPVDDMKRLEAEQLLHQVELLREQLKTVRRPFYLKSAFYYGLIGAIVALGGLGFQFVQLRSQAATISSQNEDLDAQQEEIEQLESQKAGLETTVSTLNSEIASASARRDALVGEHAALERDIAHAQGELVRLRAELNDRQSTYQAALDTITRRIDLGELPADVVQDVTAAAATIPAPDLLACDLGPGGLFMAVGQAGTVISTRDGANWRAARVGAAELRCLDQGQSAPTVAIGTATGQLLVSRDGGEQFIAAPQLFAQAVEVVSVSPDGQTIAARSVDRLARSVDAGETWSFAELSSASVPSDSIVAEDVGTLIVVTNGPPARRGDLGEVSMLRYPPRSLDDARSLESHRMDGGATAVWLNPAGALYVATWKTQGANQEFWSRLHFVDMFESTVSRKIAASRVPWARNLWGNEDGTGFAVVSKEGELIGAEVNLSAWQPLADVSERVLDITGNREGSTLWAVGERGLMLRRTGRSGEFERVEFPRLGEAQPEP